MAITFDITVPEIVFTTGQTTETAQNLINSIRLFEDDFQMMSNSKIANAVGKAPLGGGVFTEIILTLLEGNEGPWTIRFVDETVSHTSITGGTFLATDSSGDPRVVTTNPSLTINQSVSGVLVESGVSGLTASESTKLTNIDIRSTATDRVIRNRYVINRTTGMIDIYSDDSLTILDSVPIFEDQDGVTPVGATVTRIDRREKIDI